MEITLKKAKEIAKRNHWTFRKDYVWGDLILTVGKQMTLHFYDDLEDAIHTMLHLEKVGTQPKAM